MNILDLVLLAALFATAGSGVSYLMAARMTSGADPSVLSQARGLEHSKAMRIGRLMMAGSLVLLVIASAGLLILFLRHDFRYEYVVSNSSSSLRNLYIVSAFWAGQEGSLLLWTLFSAVFGCLLMLTSKKHEQTAMPWYALAQVMLLVVAVRMTPFRMLAEPPLEGFGLNPLLMNPWMAIHPPIVFAGYAAIAAPYALAMSALTRKEYGSWVSVGIWWNLLAWLLLGSGIMIGARWAYAVLGWGGYWGWDPVENASLIPWLFGAALLHTFLSQKARGKMIRTNIALAIVTYLLIGYGAFLTRSGILADFSVHSFSDLGISSYLILFMIAIGLPALVLYIMRFKDMTASRKYKEVYERFTSRDFGVFMGALVLLASAFITLLGTSAPILTGLTGDPKAVDSSFYNITNYPLGVIIALFMGLFPLFRWGEDELRSAKVVLIASAALSAASTLAVMALGATGAFYLAFLFASFFGLFSNLYMFAKTIRHGLRHIGSYMTHLGVALVFAGIIATGGWSATERVMVPIGGKVDTVGITIEATSLEESADGTTTTAHIKLYKAGKMIADGAPYMQITQMGSTMRHPMIYSVLTQDIYISPLMVEDSGVAAHGSHIQVKKTESVVTEGFSLSFVAFDLALMNSGKVGALIKAEEGGKSVFEGTLYYSTSGAGLENSYTTFEGTSGKYMLTLENIDAGAGLVYLDLSKAVDQPLETESQLLVEVSRKPFVWLLWIGAVTIIAGTAVAVVKRKMEAR